MAGDCCRQPDYLSDFAAGWYFGFNRHNERKPYETHYLGRPAVGCDAARAGCRLRLQGRIWTHNLHPRPPRQKLPKQATLAVRPYTPPSSLPPTAPHTPPRQTAYEGSSASGGQTVAGGTSNEQVAAAQQRPAKRQTGLGRRPESALRQRTQLRQISGTDFRFGNAVKQAETELNNLSK